ncbi:MAG: hypothetical protein Q7R34_00875, partial [Dehalococcoidia bacterium]|nr:hypothetical protein [Dehalococcoidia bacterium]
MGINKSLKVILGVILIISVTLLIAPFRTAQAAPCTKTWVSAVSGNWTDATKWSGGIMPGSGDSVCINTAGTYTVTLTGGANVADVTVGAVGN